ncbi:hypothetical protein STEG23_032916 [Scotinomys teguina]
MPLNPSSKVLRIYTCSSLAANPPTVSCGQNKARVSKYSTELSYPWKNDIRNSGSGLWAQSEVGGKGRPKRGSGDMRTAERMGHVREMPS